MGVMIRHYDKKELKGYVRVTVGKPEQTDVLMKCLKKLSQEQNFNVIAETPFGQYYKSLQNQKKIC